MVVLTPRISGFLLYGECLIVCGDDGKCNGWTFFVSPMCSGRLAYIISITSLFWGQGYRKYQGFHCVLISTKSWYFLYRKCSVNCSHPFLCWRINLKPKNNICPSSTGAGLYGIKCSIVHFNGLRSRIRWER